MSSSSSSAADLAPESTSSAAEEKSAVPETPQTPSSSEPVMQSSLGGDALRALLEAAAKAPSEDANDGEVAQDTYDASAACQTQYEEFKEQFGQDHHVTLLAGLEWFNQLIQLYKLTECDTLLEDIYPGCKAAGGELYIKVVQAFAFLRYKQFRIKESITYFEEMEKLVGPSPALLENMGHAYNNAQMEDKAEEYFSKALRMLKIQQEAGEQAGQDVSRLMEQRGGSLLGLGVMFLHQGKVEKALDVLLEGLQVYRSAHKNDHSIVAKSSMYVGDAYRQLDQLDKAEEMYKESVRIFRVTCGSESPLTCTALHKHGQVLLAKLQPGLPADEEEALRTKAVEVLEEAFMRTCVDLDIHSIRLSTVSELLIVLYNTQSSVEKQSFAQRYIEWCDTVLKKLEKKYGGEIPHDGNSAVFFKTYAELCILAGKLKEAVPLFSKAITALKTLNEPQATQLLNDCTLCLNLLLKSTRSKKS